MNYRQTNICERCETLRIISVGDAVPEGCFVVQSRFSRLINLSDEGNLVSIALRGKEPGPATILVEADSLVGVDEVTVTPDAIRLAGEHFVRSKQPLFASHACGKLAAHGSIPTALLETRRLVYPISPAESLVYLLDASCDTGKRSGFETRLSDVLRSGAKAFCEGDFLLGTRTMRGCGFGLTPSGDDFIAGFLAGMAAIEAMGGRTTCGERKVIVTEALGKNSLSNHFLRLAAEGKMFESLRDTVSAMLSGNRRDAVEAAMRLVRVGETSGADMLVGLVTFLERELQQCQFV